MRQILVAASASLLVALLCTPLWIRYIVNRGWGQLIRDDGPASHATKRGTPTMGGVVIVAATVIGYAVAHLGVVLDTDAGPTASALLVLGLMVGLGLVGFLDDYIKVRKQRSLGLTATAKFVGQLVLAVVFGLLVLQFENDQGLTPAVRAVSFVRESGVAFGAGAVGLALFLLWVYLLVAATSNAVNLTDGLDGLASGTAAMVFGAYVIIAFWKFGNACSTSASAACYEVRDPLDLALVAAAALGACFGFLWWNAGPAQIFMGDTGSLAIGGALAGLALTTRTELLLVVLGGLFVVEVLSVLLQVLVFRVTRGRRVFRMAPVHHHFELSGWAENTVIVRFWILAGLAVALGLGIFYAEYLTLAPLGVLGVEHLAPAPSGAAG